MTTLQENEKIMQSVAWFIALCVIAALLLGCSPYAAMPATATPSAAPNITATAHMVAVATATPTPDACTVTGYLNFRTSPNRRGAVIRVLEAGERVTVLEAGIWNRVTTRNRTGYIYSKFCK